MPGQLITGKRKGINTIFRQFATHLDLENGRYRIMESVLGLFRWGEFEPLPKIEYVLVFRQHFAKCESCTLDDFENDSSSYYQISLVHHKTKRIVVHETRNKREAFELTNRLAKEMHLPILDSATNRRKSSWIKPY